MSYIKDFTIRPAKGKFLQPIDLMGKVAEGQECCVINSNGEELCAIHTGGYFTGIGNGDRVWDVMEATPIPNESQWPAGSDWSTDDWEDRVIYPPRPVQQAVLIVEIADGRTFEVPAPFTDECPEDEAKQREYQIDLDMFESMIRKAYRLTSPLLKDYIDGVATRWAWQEKPNAK